MINVTGPVALRKTGLVIPGQLSLSVWEKIGTELASLTDSSTWWLADWVLYGETAYTGRYREVIERTGLGYQTLRNYAWVARRFGLPRRRAGLSFAHHAEVAALGQAEQDYWLHWAEQEGWSRNQLRKEIRASLAEREGAEARALPAGDEQASAVDAGLRCDPSDVLEGIAIPRGSSRSIEIRLSPEQLTRCEQLATAHGLSLDDWAAEVLRAAVDELESSKMGRQTVRMVRSSSGLQPCDL